MEALGPPGLTRRGASSATGFLPEPPQAQEPARQEASRKTRPDHREKLRSRVRDRRNATASSARKAKHIQALPGPRRRCQPRDTSAKPHRNRNSQRVPGKEGPSPRPSSRLLLFVAALPRLPAYKTLNPRHPQPTRLRNLHRLAARIRKPGHAFIHGLLGRGAGS